VDGVMIGRAALARPWLFRQAQAALTGQPVPPDPTPAQERQLLLDYYRLVVERFGPERGTILMRRYACSYAQSRRGSRQFRARVSLAGTPDEFIEALDRYFAE
jgi:tRNA-dihydrouridine synthase B